MSVRDREDAVIARLSALAPHLDGEPDPAFRAAARARLVAMAAVRTPAPPPASALRRFLTEGLPTPARWRTRLTAGLAGAALTVTALATVVAVAEDARPGDALYGVKRGTEQTQLALAGDARGRILLDLAATRLDEVRSLVDEGATALSAAGSAQSSRSSETELAAVADHALVVETLGTMDAQTAEGAAWLTERALTTGSADPLRLLSSWASTQSGGLAELRDDVPDQAQYDVAESLVLLADIETRVTGLESALGCATGPAVVAADDLGPVPGPCLPEGSTATPPGAAASGSGVSTGGSVASPAAPGSGTAAVPSLPGPSVPSVEGTVPGAPGSSRGPALPTKVVPPRPTTGLPQVPAPPPTSLSVPRLPGTSGLPAPTATPPPTLEACLEPIPIGDC
jgi:hypothetical protein